MAALLVLTSNFARAQVALTSDLGVTLTASPSTGLTTGQPIDIIVTVTNYGPDTVDYLTLQSSTFFDEFGQFVTNPDECFLFATVADAYPRPYYYINWAVALLGEPEYPVLTSGETRTCHFQMRLSAEAPAAVPLSWEVPTYFVDANRANDIATVVLRRAVAPIPTLSRIMLLLLSLLIVSAAAVTRLRFVR